MSIVERITRVINYPGNQVETHSRIKDVSDELGMRVVSVKSDDDCVTAILGDLIKGLAFISHSSKTVGVVYLSSDDILQILNNERERSTYNTESLEIRVVNDCYACGGCEIDALGRIVSEDVEVCRKFRTSSDILDGKTSFTIHFPRYRGEWDVNATLEGLMTNDKRVGNSNRNALETFGYAHYSSIVDECELPADVPGIKLNLEAGDSLYIPRGWWHWFVTEPQSFAVNQWFDTDSYDPQPETTLEEHVCSSLVKDDGSLKRKLTSCISKGIPLIIRGNTLANRDSLPLSALTNQDLRKITNEFPHWKEGKEGDYRNPAPVDGDERGYVNTVSHLNKWEVEEDYGKQFIKLKAFINCQMPKFVCGHSVVDNNLWFHDGDEPVDTGLHYDDHHGIQNVFRGKKTVILIHPLWSQRLHPLTVTDTIRKYLPSPYPNDESYIINNGLCIRPNMFQHVERLMTKNSLPGSAVLHWSLKAVDAPLTMHQHVRDLQIATGTGRLVWSLKNNKGDSKWEYYAYFLDPHRSRIDDTRRVKTIHFDEMKQITDKYYPTVDLPPESDDTYVLSVDSHPDMYGTDRKEPENWHTYHTTSSCDLNRDELLLQQKGRYGHCMSWNGESSTREQDFYISDPLDKEQLERAWGLWNKSTDIIRGCDMLDCSQGACVFVKHIRGCMSIFFHTVPTNKLIEFMEEYEFDENLVEMIKCNKDRLDHVPWDVCIDVDKEIFVPLRTAIYSTV